MGSCTFHLAVSSNLDLNFHQKNDLVGGQVQWPAGYLGIGLEFPAHAAVGKGLGVLHQAGPSPGAGVAPEEPGTGQLPAQLQLQPVLGLCSVQGGNVGLERC